MQIRLDAQQRDDQSLDTTYFLAKHLCPGKARRNQRYQDLQQKLSAIRWQPLLVSSLGWDTCWKIWVLIITGQQSCFVTTKQPCTLQQTQRTKHIELDYYTVHERGNWNNICTNRETSCWYIYKTFGASWLPSSYREVRNSWHLYANLRGDVKGSKIYHQ